MAFSLEAVFGVDASGVRAELKSLRKDLNGFVQEYGKLGAGVAVAAFVALSKGAIDLAGKLSDTSQNLNINVESLQALEVQHKRNGVSQEQLIKALEKTKSAVIAASEGDEKAIASLGKLGLKTAELVRLPLDKQYEAIATAASKATDQNLAYSAVTEILGEKVGPRLMTSLRELGTVGLPGVTKAAKEAGQVMSAETITALDRAGDAIDDFKKKATIAVGNIIVNFRSAEGLQLLNLQFMKILAQFGARFIDVLVEANDFIGAVVGGSLKGVANLLRDTLLDGVAATARALNAVLPEKLEINIAGIEALKSAGTSISDEVTLAIAQTKPLGLTESIGASFDEAISKQQKVVDELNKVEFGDDADKLRGGLEQGAAAVAATAPPLKAALTQGAAAVVESAAAVDNAFDDGVRIWKDGIGLLKTVVSDFSSAMALYSSHRGGADFNTASDSALEEIVTRNRQKAIELRNNGLAPNANYFNRQEAGRLESEAQTAANELALRQGIRRSYDRGGTEGVYRNYGDKDPIMLDKLIEEFAKNRTEAEVTSSAVVNLDRNISRLLNRPTG